MSKCSVGMLGLLKRGCGCVVVCKIVGLVCVVMGWKSMMLVVCGL